MITSEMSVSTAYLMQEKVDENQSDVSFAEC